LSGFGGSLGLSALVFTSLVVIAPSAQALSCPFTGYGIQTLANDSYHYGSGASDISWRDIPITGCIIVRSIYIWHDGANEAEIGWYQDGDAQHVVNCTIVYSPHVFVWERYNDNVYKCKPDTPAYLQGSSTTNFKILEANDGLNNVDYYWGATYLGYYNAKFANGESWAYDEIHDSVTSTNLLAGFHGLTFYGTDGNPNDWSQDPIECNKVGSLPGGWYWHQVSSQHWREDQTSPGSGC
jgi:hypothetical protein